MPATDRKRISFLASSTEVAQSAKSTFVNQFGDCE